MVDASPDLISLPEIATLRGCNGRRHHLAPPVSRLPAALSGRQQLSAESLVGAITALICLHYLGEEPLCPDGYTPRQVVDQLRDRAEADWDDEFLRSEIDALPLDAAWLAWAVDEPVEAA